MREACHHPIHCFGDLTVRLARVWLSPGGFPPGAFVPEPDKPLDQDRSAPWIDREPCGTQNGVELIDRWQGENICQAEFCRMNRIRPSAMEARPRYGAPDLEPTLRDF